MTNLSIAHPVFGEKADQTDSGLNLIGQPTSDLKREYFRLVLNFHLYGESIV
jgi:hypothetical protein